MTDNLFLLALGLTALGLLLRRFARRGGMARPGGPALPVRLVALATGGATLLFMGNLALRGGAAVPANAILGFLVMWTGFLWPAFYFAGVGIVWKILKSAQVLSRAAEEIVPPRAFAAACALVFAGGKTVSEIGRRIYTTLPDGMAENHAIVQDLIGAGEANERLIRAAMDSGALGAKLSGAGRGGTIIALHEDPDWMGQQLLAAGAERLIRLVPSPGLTIERF